MEPLLTEQSNATCCRKWGNFHNLAENANLSYYLWAWQNKSWQFSPAGTKRCCTRRLGEGCALCRAKVVWMVVPMSWDHSLQDCSISTTKPCCNSMQWFLCVCVSIVLPAHHDPMILGVRKGSSNVAATGNSGFHCRSPCSCHGSPELLWQICFSSGTLLLNLFASSIADNPAMINAVQVEPSSSSLLSGRQQYQRLREQLMCPFPWCTLF